MCVCVCVSMEEMCYAIILCLLHDDDNNKFNTQKARDKKALKCMYGIMLANSPKKRKIETGAKSVSDVDIGSSI